MKSGPHDQKSYIGRKPRFFLFVFLFLRFYILSYVYIKIVSLLECIIFLCFFFFSILVRLS